MAKTKSDCIDTLHGINVMLERASLIYFEHYFGRNMHLIIRRSDDDPKWGVYKRSQFVSLDLPVVKRKFVTAAEGWIEAEEVRKAMEQENAKTDSEKTVK